MGLTFVVGVDLEYAMAVPGQSQFDDGGTTLTESTADAPTGAVTLRQALGATLQNSPRLMAYSWEVRSSEALVVQAGLRPNPELSINPENFVGSGTYDRQSQFQNTLQLSQLVELGDKRRLRTEVARAAWDRTRNEYETKRTEVLGDATVDFITAVSDQEDVQIAKLALDQAVELGKAVEKRIKASIGSPLEAKRATVLVARARNRLRQAERAVRVSRQKLAANWAGSGADIERVVGDLFTLHAIPGFEVIVQRIASAPDRQFSLAEERVRSAETALARSRRIADIVVSGAWRQGRDWEDQTIVAGVSFPLKIFDRAQGEIASSEARVQGATAETSAVENRLRAALYGLYQEVAQAKAETESFASEIVPRTEEELVLARAGFAKGIYSQLDLLEAQRTLVEVRREQVQAAARFHRLVAEIEKLLGTPL